MSFEKVNSENGTTLDDILEQTAKEYITKWQEEGLDEKTISERLDQKIPAAYQRVIEKAQSDYFQYAKEHFHEMALHHRMDTAPFLAHQEQKWGDCFAASEAMYEIVIEASDEYRTHVRNDIPPEKFAEHQYIYGALLHIHARICQIYLEVLCLNRNGFADGAYARWRTMYELCCYADFIKQSGEKTAQAFIKQNGKNEKCPMWAKTAPCFADKSERFKPNFDLIEQQIGFKETWDKHYKLACAVTHASPEGTFGRLSNVSGMNCIPVGRSDYGITTPAEHATIVLSMATAIFFTVFPNAESIAKSEMLRMWVGFTRELYFSTEKEIFENLNEQEDD